MRSDGGYRINGEKWFVTTGDVASVLIVVVNVIEDGEKLPTLFAVDTDAAGVEFIAEPQFTHNYPEGHPTITFTDVEVPESAVIGGIGNGDDGPARLVHRGAARDRCPWGRRDVAAARGDRRAGRPGGSRADPGSTTTRASPSRSPTRPPTRPSAGC